MAYAENKTISGLDAVTSLATDDVLVAGDTSDTNRAKKITKANLVADLGDEAQTLTNKTLDADSNTVSNIGNEEIKAGVDAVKIGAGAVSNTEFGYVNGVTSAIQTQLDAKVADTGNETIAGVKTFSSFPVTPSSAPTTDYQTANKKYVDDNAGGSPLTTKGDLFGYSTTSARVPIGTNNQVLTADSTEALGLKWSTPAGGGDVVKVGTPVDSQIGVWTGDGTIEGTSGITYDGSNFQLTGDIGATGSRITKGWYTDLQVTNAIAGSITGNSATVTTITGLAPDTATTQASQPNITSLGTLTTLSVDNITINGNEISSTDTNGNIDLAPDGTGIVKGELKRFMVQLLADDTDQATDTTIGGDFRISNRAITVKAVGAYVDTAGVTGTSTIDINEAGTSILSTKITIDTTEKSSETAATAPVISDSAIAADAIVTFDIDAIHSGTAAKGLKVWVDYIYS